ncbi:MAG TPA: hypothetical protein VMZ06_01015 [Candidatus Bathyarchaeia archaeon]|nr:hypothetical protein [Candidatus Bathyarchaeia archaeon]
MNKPSAPAPACLALAAVIMAYGWGYRGTVGHEAGAMVPGALLGLAVSLGSGRPDWQRRAAVAGLFGAIGWAWGGCLSYMEHTSYVLSDSFPNVLYGYAILFFLGALWAGIGGGVLGLALTEPRSELERLIRPFTAIAATFLAAHLCFLFSPRLAEAYETLSVRQFHDGEWLAATIVLVVSGAYWLARPKDRRATALFFWGAAAWWIGYGGLTKLGGLRLAPLHRSESWGGVLGMLVVLLVYLARRQNRAALMLSLYGIVGGGFAFSLAVFFRHPIVVHWGPFTGNWPQWRVAEVLFGLFMGFAIALGCRRLIRGRIEPAIEDTPRAPLDVYAVFVMLVALTWMNFRRHAAPWIDRYDLSWTWYVLGGVVLTLPVLYVLYRYLRGVRRFVPASAYGKGAAVALALVWLTVAGYAAHDVPSRANLAGYLLLWAPAAIATLLLIRAPRIQAQSIDDTVARSAGVWRVGRGYAIAWAIAPVFLIAITSLGMTMQDGPPEGGGRKRFGPDAYWRQTARLLGVWEAVGVAEKPGGEPVEPENAPVTRLEFKPNRDVTATMPSGEVVETHQWFLKNQYTWLHWYGRIEKHPEKSELPLEFQGNRLYIALPSPHGAYTVFERTE